ncbi:DNA polymerase theta [Nymphon striatum]|nr:DNA polymerase theta [Nymphon striatum]
MPIEMRKLTSEWKQKKPGRSSQVKKGDLPISNKNHDLKSGSLKCNFTAIRQSQRLQNYDNGASHQASQSVVPHVNEADSFDSEISESFAAALIEKVDCIEKQYVIQQNEETPVKAVPVEKGDFIDLSQNETDRYKRLTRSVSRLRQAKKSRNTQTPKFSTPINKLNLNDEAIAKNLYNELNQSTPKSQKISTSQNKNSKIRIQATKPSFIENPSTPATPPSTESNCTVVNELVDTCEYKNVSSSRNMRSEVGRISSELINLLTIIGTFSNELLSFSALPSNTSELISICDLSLPECIINCYKDNGVSKMYSWQAECLSKENVINGGNLVYAAPTSAGKTLVAEILMLKTVLERKKKAIMILPFVSLAREKMLSFQKLFQEAGVKVDGFMGSHSAIGGLKACDIVICTIEKANSLINRLLEEQRLNEIGLIAVDELHMIGDSHRGYLLELLLTKVRFSDLDISNKEDNSESDYIQIIGMSATLPNLDVLARWLNADYYVTDYRPVPLTEYVKIGKTVYNSHTMKKVRQIDCNFISTDTDHSILLSLETVTQGHGVLIFCPTKNWCEKLAQVIAKEFFEIGKPGSYFESLCEENAMITSLLRSNLSGPQLKEVLVSLKNCPAGLDSVLSRTVPFGVAFHHAGLTFNERDIIEDAFRTGRIKVLIATSTLSSGVNLPARRVIIKSPVFYGSLIDTLVYKQMVGRAGRKGVDSEGESFILCKEEETNMVKRLMASELKSVQSCLVQPSQTLSSSMKRAILEVVVAGVTDTPDKVLKYISCTLLASTVDSDTNSTLDITSCIDFLIEMEFVRLDSTDGIKYVATQLGKAVLASSLSPDEGLRVFSELQRARRSFVLENDLHIVYQVTPIYVADQINYDIDWYKFLSIWESLPADCKRVGELVGVEERFIVRGIQGRVNRKVPKQDNCRLIHLRFYTALALNDLINEIPLMTVCQKYGYNKGALQSLQQSAATFAGMVTVFCNRLSWVNLELLLTNYQSRLDFGIQRELCDLIRISLLNGRQARSLFNAGYETVAGLANASVPLIENVMRNSLPFQSSKRNENETAHEASKRIQHQNVFLINQKGLTEFEAAELIIQEARIIVQKELGVDGIIWQKSASSLLKQKGNNENASLSSTKLMENIKNQSKSGGIDMCEPKKTTILYNEEEDSSVGKNETFGKGIIHEEDKVLAINNESHKSVSAFENANNDKKCADDMNESVDACKENDKIVPNDHDENSQEMSIKLVEELNSLFFGENISDQKNISVSKQEDVSKEFRNKLNEKDLSSLSKEADPEEKPSRSEDKELDLTTDNLDVSNSCSFLKKLEKCYKNSKQNGEDGGSILHNNDNVISLKYSSASNEEDGESSDISWNSSVIWSPSCDVKHISVLKNSRSESDGNTEQVSSNRPNSQDLSFSDDSNSQNYSLNDEISKDLDKQGIPEKVLVQNITQSGVPELREEFEAKESEDMFDDSVSSNDKNDFSSFLSSSREDLNEAISFINISDSTLVNECEKKESESDSNSFNNDCEKKESESDSNSFNNDCEKKESESHSNSFNNDCEKKESESHSNSFNATLMSDDSLEAKCLQVMEELDESIRNSILLDKDTVSLIEDLNEDKIGTNVDNLANNKLNSEVNLPPGTTNKNTKINVLEKSDSNLEGNLSEYEGNKRRSSSDFIPPTPVVDSAKSFRKVNTINYKSTNSSNNSCNRTEVSLSSIDIVDVCHNQRSYEDFHESFDKLSSFSFSFVKSKTKPQSKVNEDNYIGFAVTWKPFSVYYVSFHEAARRESLKPSTDIPPRLKKLFLKIFNKKNVTVSSSDIKMNFKFLLSNLCFEPAVQWSDLVIAQWLLNPDMQVESLHEIYENFFPEEISVIQSSVKSSTSLKWTSNKEKETISKIITELVLVQKLDRKLRDCLKQNDLFNCYFQNEMPSLINFIRMEVCGIGFDVNRNNELVKNLQNIIANLEEMAFALAKRRFNPSSTNDVSCVLYKELRLVPPGVDISKSSSLRHRPSFSTRAAKKLNIATEAAGGYNTKKETLEKMKNLHPLPGIILEWRKVHCILKKVLYPLAKFKLYDEETDMVRIYSNFMMPTVTGRVSFCEPNLQNIAKDFTLEAVEDSHTETISLRSVFIPCKGFVFVSADYSQLELRLLTHFSKDRNLLKIFNNGGDVFMILAAKLNKCNIQSVTATQRQQAKQICYGIIYGMGTKTLSEHLGVEKIEEAEEFMENFHNSYPGYHVTFIATVSLGAKELGRYGFGRAVNVKKYIEKVLVNCKKLGFVETLVGRKRFLSAINDDKRQVQSHAERQALNTIIQGSAADIAKTAMNNIQTTLKNQFSHCNENNSEKKLPCSRRTKMVLQLHDELIYEVELSNCKNFTQVLKYEMEHAFQLNVPLIVKVKVGYSWGTLKEIDS